MGQQANSRRRASLDDRKLRAAGRGENQMLSSAVSGDDYGKGKTAGAFGRDDVANRKSPETAMGASAPAMISAGKRPARKRGK